MATEGLFLTLSGKGPFGFSWPKKPIKALGVYFSYNQADKDNENFTLMIKKIKAALNVWCQSNLTLIGRITIVKTLALTKLTFISSFESVPDLAIKETESAIYSFIWK